MRTILSIVWWNVSYNDHVVDYAMDHGIDHVGGSCRKQERLH